MNNTDPAYFGGEVLNVQMEGRFSGTLLVSDIDGTLLPPISGFRRPTAMRSRNIARRAAVLRWRRDGRIRRRGESRGS